MRNRATRNRAAILSSIVFTLLVAFALVPATFSLANEGSSAASRSSESVSLSGGGSTGGSSASGSSATSGSNLGSGASGSSSGSSSASGSGSDSGSNSASGSGAGGSASASGSTLGSGSGSSSVSGSTPLSTSGSDSGDGSKLVAQSIPGSQGLTPQSSYVIEIGENGIPTSKGIYENGYRKWALSHGAYDWEIWIGDESDPVKTDEFSFTGDTGCRIVTIRQINGSGTTFSNYFEALGGACLDGGKYLKTVVLQDSSILDGTFIGWVTAFVGTIHGGTFSGAVTLTASTVDGGTFTNIVEAKSAGGPGTLINGGTFTATSTVTTNSVAIIKNGTFNGSVYNSGTVDGGSFQSYVYNSGTVSNGAFDSNVTNETGGSITGGTFRGGVTNNGTLFGGDFKETVNSFGSISGGSYSNDVYNESDASITGGTFNRYIYNSGTITGGTLLGIVENKGSGSVTPGDSLSYGVTYRLKGITSSNTATLTASNRDYQTTLSSTNGNALPLAIRVTMNGVTATPGTDYTWDDTTGALTIMKATELAKMGPITISAGNGYLFFVSYTGPNDGTFKGSSYYQYCDNGESFDVASPMIAGYAPDKTEIKGTIEGENLSATVTYSPITYTVAFDANGGTGAAMAPMSFTYGQAQNLSTCTFSRTGYTFAGWATTTGTTTANYTDGQSVGNLTSTAGAQKTLYAVWTPRTNIQYHVRYFKAGLDGSFGVNPDETVNGFGTAGQQTAAAEKTYEGFTVRPFRQTTIAGDGSTFVDIYYDRDVHSVSVVYVGPSDGTFSAPAQHAEDVVYGATYSVESPTVTGYAPDVATVAGTMGTSDVSTTVTYSPITYTVAFNANGGTGSMTPMTLTYDTSANLTDNEFTAPTGYHFAGWAISTADAAAGTVAYADGASVGNLATAQDTVVTLYAVWTEDDNITISYVSADALMGTVTPGSESLAPATGKAKGAVATPNPGYRFVSWTTQAELRPNSADDQATDSLATQSALTTQSTLATQSAGSSSTAGSAGSSAGGSAGGSAGTSNSASTPIVLGPNPSAIVVSTDPTLTGAVVDAVTKASGAYITTTFTANFAPVTYTVAFNTNGGSGSMDPMTLTYGTADTLTANTFTREGHTFTGWNTKPDGTGTSYADGQSVSNLATTQDDTVTLYAQWTFMGSPTPTKPATTTALPGTGDASASTASGLIAMTIAGGMLLLLGLGMFVARRRRA